MYEHLKKQSKVCLNQTFLLQWGYSFKHCSNIKVTEQKEDYYNPGQNIMHYKTFWYKFDSRHVKRNLRYSTKALCKSYLTSSKKK